MTAPISRSRFVALNLLIPLPLYLMWLGFYVSDLIPRHDWRDIPWTLSCIATMPLAIGATVHGLKRAYGICIE